VFLNNINYTVKNISYLSLLKVEYITINKKLVLNLDLLILKREGDAICKRVRVYKLDYKQVIMSSKGQGALLESYLNLI
jgi:hypothetical protein